MIFRMKLKKLILLVINMEFKSLTEREGLEFMLGDTITMINDESFYPATPDGDCKVIEIFKTQTEVRQEAQQDRRSLLQPRP